MDVCSSIKEKNRLLKETNRLLSKGMLNVYLQFTIEKNWPPQNLDFLSFGELQLMRVSLSFKTSCCNLKIRGLGVKL